MVHAGRSDVRGKQGPVRLAGKMPGVLQGKQSGQHGGGGGSHGVQPEGNEDKIDASTLKLILLERRVFPGRCTSLSLKDSVSAPLTACSFAPRPRNFRVMLLRNLTSDVFHYLEMLMDT